MAQISTWIILTNVYFIICEFRWIEASVFPRESQFKNDKLNGDENELKTRIKRDTDNITISNDVVNSMLSCNINSKFTCICENCFKHENCCTTLFSNDVTGNSMQIMLIFIDEFVYNSTNEVLLKTTIKNSILQYCQLYKDRCVNNFNVSFNSIEYLNYSKEALTVFILDIDFKNRTSVSLLLTVAINICLEREEISSCNNNETSTDIFQNANFNYAIVEPKFLASIIQNQTIYFQQTLGLHTMFINETMEVDKNEIEDDNADEEAKKQKIYRDLIIMGGFFGSILVISCFASVIKAIKDRRATKKRIIQKRRERQEKANGECAMASGEVKHCNGNMLEEGAAMNGHVNKHDVTVTIENGFNNATNINDAYAPPPYQNGKLESSKPATDISNKAPDAVISNGGIQNGGASLFAPHVVTIENHPCSDEDAMQSSNDHSTQNDGGDGSEIKPINNVGSDVSDKNEINSDKVDNSNNSQYGNQNDETDNGRSTDQIKVNATIENIKEIEDDSEDKLPQNCDDSKDESTKQDNLDNKSGGKECKLHSISSGVVNDDKIDDLNSLDCDDDKQNEFSNNSDNHGTVVEHNQRNENCDSYDIKELKTRI